MQRESQTGHEFHIFWVPRRTVVSDKLLEEAGVLGDVNIAELPLFFFPLERDVLSLELDDSFEDLYLSKDPTPLFLLAKALMGIQQTQGLFPRMIGKGDNAKRVAELLARMRQELLAGEDANETSRSGLTPSNTTESLIIIDREVDSVTPLLTQLTYEGPDRRGLRHSEQPDRRRLDRNRRAHPLGGSEHFGRSRCECPNTQTQDPAGFVRQALRPAPRYELCHCR